MGILTDFFIASDEELQALPDDALPAQELQGIMAKSVESVNFALFEAIIRDTDFDDALDAQILISEKSDDGPWIYLVTQEFTMNLAEIDDSKLKSIGDEWRKELAMHNWSSNEMRTFLVELRSLAREAVASGRNMYHWLSL
jgi:hypothetical protein